MADLKNGTTINGQVVWHAGNDGAGSGLDADLLRGITGDKFARGNTRLTPQQLQNTMLDAGIYTNDGQGLLNENGTAVALPGWWHVIVGMHLDNNGYGFQLAFPLSASGHTTMYKRYATGTTWTPWQRVWDETVLRWNPAGYLEINIGGTWRPVASNKTLIPSNNVRSANNPEHVVSVTGNSSEQHTIVLVHKWIPPFDGVVNLYGEIRVNNPNDGTSIALLIYSDFTAKKVISDGISYVLTGQLYEAVWDYTTPIGTIYTGTTPTGMGVGLIASTTSTSYVGGTKKVKVFKGEPVFICARLITSASSGEARTGYARNIQIKYDELSLQ